MIVNTLEGVRGSTWLVKITSVELDGAEVSAETLALCTIGGRLGGVAITGSEIDPSPGVRLIVRVSAAASAAAVVASAPYTSQIDITFPGGDKLTDQFKFKVLPSAD